VGITSGFGVREDGSRADERAEDGCSGTDRSGRCAEASADGDVSALHESPYCIFAVEDDDEFGEVCTDLCVLRLIMAA
jgi:hypothetical protein